MQNATSTQAYNPYIYTPSISAPVSLPPQSPTGPTVLPQYMAPPNVSLTGPANNDTFNYVIGNPNLQQVVAKPVQNVSYPLNTTNTLTGPLVDTFSPTGTSSTSVPSPFNSTVSTLPAPFKAATIGPDFNNPNFTLNLTDAANTQFKPVPPVTAVAPNPFAAGSQTTTTIPAYTGQPGQQLNVMG